MHIRHWDFRGSDFWWAGLALFGCIAMAVFEALSFRLLVLCPLSN
jgi:hypothetical protein